MKRWIQNNQVSLLTFMALSVVTLVGTFAFGVDPLATLPFAGIAGAVTVRGAMDQLVTIKYTHTAATVSDTIYLLGGRVMLAANSAAANVENVFLLRGHIEHAKAAVAVTGGATLYWDDTNKVFTTVSTGNTKAGFAMEAAASGDATVQMFLEPATNL